MLQPARQGVTITLPAPPRAAVARSAVLFSLRTWIAVGAAMTPLVSWAITKRMPHALPAARTWEQRFALATPILLALFATVLHVTWRIVRTRRPTILIVRADRTVRVNHLNFGKRTRDGCRRRVVDVRVAGGQVMLLDALGHMIAAIGGLSRPQRAWLAMVLIELLNVPQQPRGRFSWLRRSAAPGARLHESDR